MQERNERQTPVAWTPFEHDVAAALRNEPGTVTPDCPEMAEMLDWMDQGVRYPESERMQSHVGGCPYCRREYNELRRTITIAQDIKSPRLKDRLTNASLKSP